MNRTLRYSLCGVTIETDWPLVSPLLPAANDVDLRFSVVLDAPGQGEWQVEARIKTPGGVRYLEIGRIGSIEVLRFIDIGDAWLISEDEIIFHLLRSEHDYQVEVILLGVLLAYWLERRGINAFHGACVAGDGWSIGILGPNGSGKTRVSSLKFVSFFQPWPNRMSEPAPTRSVRSPSELQISWSSLSMVRKLSSFRRPPRHLREQVGRFSYQFSPYGRRSTSKLQALRGCSETR